VIRDNGDSLTGGAADPGVASLFFCQALISIKRDAQTQSKLVTINSEGEVKVDGLPVTYSLIITNSTSFELVFKFQEDDNLSRETEFKLSGLLQTASRV
jgi:hypothetical protein